MDTTCSDCGHDIEEHGGAGCRKPVSWDALGFVKELCGCATWAVYDESGQLLTGSFMDYAMPRAVLVNNLRVIEHPVPTQSNPLGAKGVGEAGVTGSLPALMNAVLDALRQAGVEEFDMPASPHRVWKALHAARAGA